MRLNDPVKFLITEAAPEGTVLRFAHPTACLDDADAARMSEALTRFLEAGAGGHVFFELGDLAYVSSSALGAFVRLHKEMKARGGRLTLRHLSGPVYEVFEVTKLTRLIDVRPRRAEGCAAEDS